VLRHSQATCCSIRAGADGGLVRLELVNDGVAGGNDMEVVAELERGDQILPTALATRPDVAVVDIDLPGLDGLSAADQLARELPETRVLVLTGLSQPGNLLRALKVHMRGFVVKDAPAQTLADGVRRVARGERVIDPDLVAAALETGSTPLTTREADVLREAERGLPTEQIAVAPLDQAEGAPPRLRGRFPEQVATPAGSVRPANIGPVTLIRTPPARHLTLLNRAHDDEPASRRGLAGPPAGSCSGPGWCRSCLSPAAACRPGRSPSNGRWPPTSPSATWSGAAGPGPCPSSPTRSTSRWTACGRTASGSTASATVTRCRRSADPNRPPPRVEGRRLAGVRLRLRPRPRRYEHQPVRAPARPDADGPRVYRRLRWGGLAQLDVVDGRQFRSVPPCGWGEAQACEAAYDPEITMLGQCQERWLYQGFAASRARWNILGNNVMVARLDHDGPAGELLWHDAWDGFPAARNRLTEAWVEHKVSNPVVVTGDWHSTFVNDILRSFDDPSSPVVASELVGTSISSNGDGEVYGRTTAR